VLYVDYDDGYAINLLKGNDTISHIHYEAGGKANIPEGTIVIAPLSYLPLIERVIEQPQNKKYLLWSLHPYNLVSYINLYRQRLFTIGRRKRKEIGEILLRLSKKGVIRYMDYNNYYWSSKVFSFNCGEAPYIPIYVADFDRHRPNPRKREQNELSFMWLGRLDGDKYYTIATFLNELESISADYSVTFYIVGGGNREKELRKKSRATNVNVVFTGKLVGEELTRLINEKVDIGLAMGTSALDIAKHGKPVIVEGVINKIFMANELKDYVLLSEIQHYDVVSPGYYIKDEIHPFKELVKTILSDYVQCAEACEEYVHRNHTISNVGIQLEQAISSVEVTNNQGAFEDISRAAKMINKSNVNDILGFRILRRILSNV